MRLNQFIAQATGMSRRGADKAIESGRVYLNGGKASLGQLVQTSDIVSLDGVMLRPGAETITLLLNKPVGYVCSRNGQGHKTIYDLLPSEYHQLKPVGRLDKDSSGLLLLTNNGQLAHQLTHPSFQKEKVYEIELDRPLRAEDKVKIEQGVLLEDGVSHLQLNGAHTNWTVTMSEGRNRQIRRTFGALSYELTKLHRTHFGPYYLGNLTSGKFDQLKI